MTVCPGKTMQYLIALVILAAASPLVAGGGSDTGRERTTIKILHVNDVHSHLDAGAVTLTLAGEPTGCEIGGMARVAAMMSRLAAGNPDHLLLHAGDAVQGTLYYTLFKGRADADVMNAIGFDAMAIGNHEFDDGDAWLAGFSRMLDAPLLSSNIRVAPGNVLEGRYLPYTVVEVGGRQIGIIGLTISAKTRASSRPGKGVIFNSEVESVQAAVDQLTAGGIRRIIVLSHYGYDKSRILATRVTDIDIIVDGDSHSLLGNFKACGLESSGDYPTVAKNRDGDPVCIVQAWEYGKALGELDVTFLGDRLESWKGTPHLILGRTFSREDSTGRPHLLQGDAAAAVTAAVMADSRLDMVADDPAVAAVVSTYASSMNTLKNTVIGTAGEVLMYGRVPGHEYGGATLALGSDIAPLVAKAFYEQDGRADLCIQNAGGTRTGISPGELTYDTAYTLLPFSNSLFEIEMYGSEIRQVLEDAIENIARGGSTGSFPYCYGLRYDVDASQAFGSRVSGLEIRDRHTGAYSGLRDTAMYVVVTNNYLATGRDGYETFAAVQAERGKGTDTYLDYAMSFVNHVQSLTAEGKRLMKLPAGDHCIKRYIPTPETDDQL